MAYIYDIADTWSGGGAFTGIKLNVTDSGSTAGSLLMDLQVGGSSKFSVTKAGNVSLNNAQNLTIATDFVMDHYVQLFASSRIYPGGNGIIAVAGPGNRHAALGFSGLTLSSTDGLGWSSVNGWGLTAATPVRDLLLLRDAANTLAQRNGVNAQAFNLYNTYTDASNYERGFMKWNTNVLEIGAQAAGTGVLRQIRFAASAVELSSGVVFVQSDFNQSIKLHNSYGIAWGAGGVNAGSGNVTRLSTTLSSGYGVELTTGLYLGAPVLRATTGYTVATLPTTPVVGMTTRVTDATTPTVGSTVTGGGAANAMCWYNGTNWTVIGV